jgi:hypothetical protein
LFLIDGVPAEQVNVGLSTPISTVILGANVFSTRSYWADNIMLRVVPEPEASSILGPALIAVMWFGRSVSHRIQIGGRRWRGGPITSSS